MIARVKSKQLAVYSKVKSKSTITYVFLIFYCIAIAALLLSTNQGFPLGNLLGDIKWFYLAFSIVNILIHCRSFNKKILICAGILLSYILLFGLFFVNDIVTAETRQYLVEMLIYFCLLFFTYLQVRRFNCFVEFVKATYIALSAPLLLAYFTNLSDTTLNPIYFIKVIVFDLRRRSTFGFIQQNIVGAVCFLTFVISVIWFYYSIKKQHGIKKLSLFSVYMIISDLIIWMMFQSTSSRASLTSFFLFLLCFFIFEYVAKNKKAFFAFCCVGIVCAVGLLFIFGDYIWSASNRSANITANLQWVEIIGNKWTGMGFVENSAFQYTWTDGVGSSAFGVRTSSLDMYYVYLYCTTGILGCLMIGAILVYMAVLIYKLRKEPFAPIMLSIYICMLYYAFWESVIFAFRFWPFFIVFVILWCFIDGTAQESFKKVIRVQKKKIKIGEKG